MFSKEDYINYFLQIKQVELAMQEQFLKYSRAVDDPELKDIFFRLSREETAHNKIVDGMLASFGYDEKLGVRELVPDEAEVPGGKEAVAAGGTVCLANKSSGGK